MKKVSELVFEGWYQEIIWKKDTPFTMIQSNASYTYEVVKETEKAVQIKIDSKERSPLKPDWFKWIPKSAIIRL